MILLDTNVISALMQRMPEEKVVAWLDAQPRESVWTTSISVFEVFTGLRMMPAGNRQRTLIASFEQILTDLLEGRIADFDSEAARCAAEWLEEQKRNGRTMEMRDTMIAGIVQSRKATLATRNERHFVGIATVNPWTVLLETP